MRGRVLAVLLLSVVPSLVARAQCGIAPTYSAQFRSSIYGIAIDGNDLWAATGYGLAHYDRSVDPPRLLSSIPLPGTTRVVRVANGVVYAGSGTTLYAGARSVDAGDNVNDVAVTPLVVFVATDNGLLELDAGDLHLINTLTTSSKKVTSLALLNSTLYAADGDKSVEVFDISVPTLAQRTAQLDALPRTTAVHVNNGRLYASDGVQTILFTTSGTPLSAALPVGSSALAPLAGDAVYVAGNERAVHAVDFTTAQQPVELFAQELAPSGRISTIFALQRAGSRLYAAAGDIGLLSWDVSSFAAPFAVHAYTTKGTTSVATIGNALYAGNASGGIDEYKISGSGALTQARHWDPRTLTVTDASSDGFLLTTTGPTVVDWTVNATTPVPVATVTFPTTVTNAVLAGSTIYALLADRTLWSADVATLAQTKIDLGIAKPQALARAGMGIVLAAPGDATTTVYLVTSGDFAHPRSVTVPGIPTAGIAANGTTAAIFTYLGITLIDVASGAQTVIPNSTSSVALPTQLAFAGTTLLELTDTDVLAWDTATRTLAARYAMPAPPAAVAGGDNVAAVATTEGVASIVLNTASHAPSLFAAPNGNAYYKKLSAAGNRMLLFDGRIADVYEITTSPRLTASLRAPGMIDVAAAPTALFTLSNSSVVSAYSIEGALLAQKTVATGSDTVPLSIAVVNGAPWVSLSTGCLSGGCRNTTLVLDPHSLVQTASMTGAVTDVAIDGTTAFAIATMPNEVRVVDVADPLHPNVLQSRAADGTSIAERAGTVYVLGDKLYTFAASSLAPLGSTLSFLIDPTESVRIAGDCALVGGRTFAPRLYALPAIAGQTTPGLPALPQSVVARNGALFILTDDSLEVWSSGPAFAPPARRRPSR
jgi:hypothetical protein